MGLAVGLSAAIGSPALAIVRSWDDEGNSADKTWSNAGNWSPDGDPAAADDVFIGNLANAANDTTILDTNQTITSLTLSNGADVRTNDFELLVNGGITTVGGAGSTIFVEPNGLSDSLDADTLIINSGGTVNISGGILEVDSTQLEINAGGVLTGFGEIDLEGLGPLNQVFENSGTLTVNDGGGLLGTAAGTLNITTTNAAAVIDLDGDTNNGVVNINRNDTLDVNGTLESSSFFGTFNLFGGSTLDISTPWTLSSADVNVNTAGIFVGFPDTATIAGGDVTMNASTITIDTVDVDQLRLDADFTGNSGTIANSNLVIFNNTTLINAGVDFQMLGSGASVTLLDGATVTINDADFNLDGSESAGNITTIGLGALLDINHNSVGADDSFGHTINLNGGELDVVNAADAVPWQINAIGDVNAGGAASSILDGDELDIFGQVNVAANSTLNVNTSGVTWDGSADAVIAAGGQLNINTTSRWESSTVTVTGAGIFSPGSAIIGVDAADTADVVWSADTVNVDDGSHTINLGSSLTVTTDAIDNVDNSIGSTITIADTATLTIGLNSGNDVNYGGTINYNGNTASSNFLLAPVGGSAFNLTGTMNINGDGGSLARLKIGGTININDAAEDFRLEGGTLLIGNTNEINGGTINGPGEFQAGTGHALRGNGTINAAVDFDGSASLIAQNGLLTVGGGIVDVGTLGTSGGAAVLNVTTFWNTNVTSTVLLQGGRLQGSTITNDGASGINGFGEVISSINNNTVIDAEGGNLLINNTTNNWDGISNNGQLRALSGNLTARDNSTFVFEGTVQANSGRTFLADGFELRMGTSSNLVLNGGTFRSTNPTLFQGSATIGAGPASTIETASLTNIFSTASFTLNGDLRLDSTNSRIQSGAFIGGGAGDLINLNGGLLQLDDGAAVSTVLINQGGLTIAGGGNRGSATIQDLDLTTPTSVLNVDIAGLGINDTDRYTVNGSAFLGGEADFDFFGFAPSAGDTFLFMTYLARVGTFDSINVSGLGAGLLGVVDYNATNAVLRITAGIAGDYDNDGLVGQGDLDLVLLNWGDPTPPIPAGWVNDLPSGAIDQAELDKVLLNWGNTAEAGASGSAVPEPASLALLGGLGLLGLRRRAA